jgi:hypothetical protein
VCAVAVHESFRHWGKSARTSACEAGFVKLMPQQARIFEDSKHPHDTPPHPFMPSPTFEYSSAISLPSNWE